jgi:Meckel syndrome type 1 protein
MKVAAQGLITELQDAGREALAAVADVADPRPAVAFAGAPSTRPAVSAAHALAQRKIAESKEAKIALAKEKSAEARAATAGHRLLAEFKAKEAAKAKAAPAADAANRAAGRPLSALEQATTHAPEAVAMRRKIKALAVNPVRWATMTVAQRREVEAKREAAQKVLRAFIAGKNRMSDTSAAATAPAAPKPADDAASGYKVVSRDKKKAKRARTAETSSPQRAASPPPTPTPSPPPTPSPTIEDITEEPQKD